MKNTQQKTDFEIPKLSDKLADIADQSTRIINDFLRNQSGNVDDLDPFNLGEAFKNMLTSLSNNPDKIFDMQVAFWNDYANLVQNSFSRFIGDEKEPFIEEEKGDKRFSDEGWDESFVFDFLKQSYLLTSKYIDTSLDDIEGLDEKESDKLKFFTKQFVDAICPANFAVTNPQVMRETIDSGGENLVKGLQNLLDDLERGEGKLRISMTDATAFEIGKNIATTKGKVIFQNKMFQLIQYSPTTAKVAKRPVLIVPPWINKFYILDLQEKNSLIKWTVDQGHTVFIVSWINPDETYRDVSFDDYMEDGVIAAVDAIEKATGEKEINAVGYCIGGTLLASTLAFMEVKKDKRIKSATYFTTLTDFEDPGEIGVFIDEKTVSNIEKTMDRVGYLDGKEMSMTFNLLRSNDLIWSFVLNNYLLGKDPFIFDLLYWNSDSTRMPAAMHSFYLRKMYLENKLIEKNGITLRNVPIDMSKIKTPTYMISTKEDHIAPWKSTYKATQVYSGDVTFVLSGSGHIAGIINPPYKNKYCYWTNAKTPANPDAWLKDAKQHEGSWWPAWAKWLDKQNGTTPKVTARKPGAGKLKAIEDAPGSYVKSRI